MTAAARRLGLPEFTAMLAMLFATIAFSIDSMLPALPAIAAELTPAAVNRAQLILTAFVFGMGAGTLLAGPISDATGRRPAIIGGFALYALGAILAYRATTIELLLAARVIQGIGAAGPRIVGLALIRDLYEGREMARVTSFVMMVFMIVPAAAPSLGQVVIRVFGWRGIFLAYVVFAAVGALWFWTRQPETLPAVRRRPLALGSLASAAREVLTDRDVLIYAAVMTLGFGQMFALLSSIQQIFAETYGRGAHFPQWFALIAVFSASASFINSRLVMRVGMRSVCLGAYGVQAVASAVVLAVMAGGVLPPGPAFAVFFAWATGVFFMAGLTFGNLNALSLQRMGHIAGMAASIVASVATVGAVAIAAPVGLAFDGTALPVMAGAALASAAAWALMRKSTRPGVSG